MSKASLVRQAEDELKALSPGEQREVARVISLLEDDNFRKFSKIDLVLIEDGFKIWGLCSGIVWLAFVEEDDDGSVKVVHLCLLSRFRASWPS